jgi:hypothetical protein
MGLVELDDVHLKAGEKVMTMIADGQRGASHDRERRAAGSPLISSARLHEDKTPASVAAFRYSYPQ